MNRILIALSLLMLCACSFAPEYHRPTLPITASYKELGAWIQTNPDRIILYRGPWWQMYGDPILNELEQQLNFNNQNLIAALARYDEARATVAVARSQLFPSVNGLINANRENASKTIANAFSVSTFNDLIVGAEFAYQLDVWGRVRNMVAAAKNLANASQADLAAINLSLHAELANDYFSLRGADKSQQVLDHTVQMYQRALAINQHRHKEGTASASEVDLAENQLQTAKTLAANNFLKRQQFEHAIAILVGLPPAAFTIKASASWKISVVTLVPDLPSTLIERRPDIIKAEYFIKAANANIGVARAAFFPQINLAGGIGFESQSLAQLFKRPSLVWSLGPLSTLRGLSGPETQPLLTQILFDGGLNKAITDQAIAKYFESVALYRQTVLNAFREVEDSLIALRQLDYSSKSQAAATAAAQRALRHTTEKYQGGIIDYLEVVVIENIALQSELSIINIQTLRQISSVQLIKALGGDWS